MSAHMIRSIAAALIISGLLLSWTPAVVVAADAPLAAGTAITVLSYDKDNNTYKITPTNTPGEGDGTVTPEALAKAIRMLDLAKIQKDPLNLVGRTYSCETPLELEPGEG